MQHDTHQQKAGQVHNWSALVVYTDNSVGLQRSITLPVKAENVTGAFAQAKLLGEQRLSGCDSIHVKSVKRQKPPQKLSVMPAAKIPPRTRKRPRKGKNKRLEASSSPPEQSQQDQHTEQQEAELQQQAQDLAIYKPPKSKPRRARILDRKTPPAPDIPGRYEPKQPLKHVNLDRVLENIDYIVSVLEVTSEDRMAEIKRFASTLQNLASRLHNKCDAVEHSELDMIVLLRQQVVIKTSLAGSGAQFMASITSEGGQELSASGNSRYEAIGRLIHDNQSHFNHR